MANAAAELQDALLACCFLSPLNACKGSEAKRACSIKSMRGLLGKYVRGVRHNLTSGRFTPAAQARAEAEGREHRNVFPNREAVLHYVQAAKTAVLTWNHSGKCASSVISHALGIVGKCFVCLLVCSAAPSWGAGTPLPPSALRTLRGGHAAVFPSFCQDCPLHGPPWWGQQLPG